jgi:glycosyltransferase involved in cell wall biosynthesis
VTLVSVITPSYNQVNFLENTIRSVLLQDRVEIEYCVVDGASQDGSQQIIEQYRDELAWWLSEKDNGQAEAINKGFQRAQGEIIAWLNSDDLYLPGAVQRAVSELEANPKLGMVFGDAITIDAQGHPLNRLSFGNWDLLDFLGFRMICQPAVFMRRSVLEEAGYLDTNFHFMLDHHLWIRIARLAPIRHIPDLLAAARQHSGAKNVRQAVGFSQETQRLLEWMSAQPDLAEIIRQKRSYILSGAYRLQARYYLDGGQPAQSLRLYASAIRYSPSYAFKHWHRMIYALFCLVGAKNLADQTLRQASRQRKSLSVAGLAGEAKLPAQLTGQEGWPGLTLEKSS